MIGQVTTELARPVLRIAARWALAPGTDWRTRRGRLDALSLVSRPPRGTTITTHAIEGVPGERITGRGAPQPATLLYLHGGGYCTGSPRTHRRFAAALARELDAVAYVPHYRLAPEHPFPAAHDDALTCYRAIAQQADPSAPLLVAGDSAGGGLALAVALAARDEDLRQPDAVVLISPWLDLTTPITSSRGEPILTPRLIAAFTEAYAPSRSQRADRRASPLHADLSGVPRLHIESGDVDPLISQALVLERAAREACVDVTHIRHAGLWHAFHLAPIPASDRAVRGIGRAVRRGVAVGQPAFAA